MIEWLKNIKERVWDIVLNIFLSKFSNLAYLYTIIYIITWWICFYKLSSMQKEALSYVKELDCLNYNSKYVIINKCLNSAIIVNKNEHNPPQEVIIDISNKCIINNKIDINLLYNIVSEKIKLNKNLAIWDEDWILWLKFKNLINNSQNFLILNNEKLELSIKNNTEELEKINNNIVILKQTKIKLFFGFGLLLLSDFVLKTLTSN